MVDASETTSSGTRNNTEDKQKSSSYSSGRIKSVLSILYNLDIFSNLLAV